MINAGTYVLSPEAIAMIEAGRRVSIEREIFPKIVELGRCFAKSDNSYWVDAGTPETLISVAVDILSGKRDAKPGSIGIFVADGATVPADLEGSNCAIESGAIVGNNVTIRNSIICQSAVIEDRVVIEDSIIAGHVCSGAVVKAGCVIGAEGRVESNQLVSGKKIPS